MSEIQTEHIQGFLNSKTESCSQLTLSLWIRGQMPMIEALSYTKKV